MSATVHQGSVLDLGPRLEKESVQCVVTSPPYAEQWKGAYEGVSEQDYPEWTVSWMNALRPALTENASVFINIRPHIKNGSISDYVLKTRLAIRSAGWTECEELIWFKPDAPPLGSPHRPRRSYESIHWFSSTGRPFCSPWDENKTGSSFRGGGRSGFLSDDRRRDRSEVTSGNRVRVRDVFEVCINSLARNPTGHPAAYPLGVPDYLIRLGSIAGDVVLDPFTGSGTTGVAAMRAGRRFIGFELSPEFADLANKRLADGP